MIRRAVLIGVAFAACAGAPAASAASTIVYSQIFNPAAVDAGAYSHNIQQLAGEFVLGSAATLEAASWYGTMDSADPLNTGDTWNFDLRFYADAANLPGAQLLSVGVVASVIDTGIDVQGQRAYQFSATFAPLALSGGISYWFSAINTGTQQTFRWTQAITGLDSALNSNGDPWLPLVETNRTPLNFTLAATDATAVPEPATLSLLGIGLAGAVARRLRRKA